MNFYSNTGGTNMDTQTPTVGYISFAMIDQLTFSPPSLRAHVVGKEGDSFVN